jgi:hypothetical protein
MSDQEIPIVRADPQRAAMVRDLLGAAMYDMVGKVSADLQTGGASIVLLGVRVWFEELSSYNAPAAADYFRALADYSEMKLPESKANAEARRRDAVERLFASILAHIDSEPKSQGGANGEA